MSKIGEQYYYDSVKLSLTYVKQAMSKRKQVINQLRNILDGVRPGGLMFKNNDKMRERLRKRSIEYNNLAVCKTILENILKLKKSV